MQGMRARPDALRNRSFLLLWIAQAISQTAQNIINFVLIIEVEERSRSSTATSLVVLSFIIPAVVFGPIAGVFVDRTDKRRMLVVTNFLRAGAVLAYIVIDRSWPLPTALLIIYLLSAVFSTISQFFAPAEASAIPLLVSKEQLPEANSLFSLTYNSAQVAGFAFIGPLFVKLTTIRSIFFVVSSLYLICTLLVALLPALPQGVRPEVPTSLAASLRKTVGEIYDLWRFITSHRLITTAIVDLAITAAIFLMLGTLGVGLVTRVMKLPASNLAYILAAGGIGLLIGLFMVPRVISHIRGKVLIDVGMVAMGMAILGMAVIQVILSYLLGTLPLRAQSELTLLIVMFLALCMGIGSAFVSIPAQTLLQQESPPSIRGRVFASLFAFSSALAILPVLFTGALADIIGLQQVMALIGVVTLILAAVGHYRSLD